MSALVIGVDPGLSTGLFALLTRDGKLTDKPIAVQIHGHQGVVPFVQALLERAGCDDRQPLLAVEAFVTGQRAARSSSPGAGAVTRALIGALQELYADGAEVITRPAALVKPWATDRRLEAAGLLAPCAGMGHARDAARHALYAAVHAGLLRDPLSTRSAL